MLPRILNIINIHPYKIVCGWTNGEIRMIDFEPLINKYKQQKKLTNAYFKLNHVPLFLQVQLDKIMGTLFWPNLITMTDYDGAIKTAPFDICPDMLYSMSKIVKV